MALSPMILGYETTVPLNQTPDESLTTNTSTPGGATVDGRWAIKGAYLMVKLGPSFHVQFNDHWEMSGSAGFAGAYAGSTYSAVETFTVADLPTDGTATAGVQGIEESAANKFVTGYYADLTIQWTANETTGIYGGVTAQQLSSYEQMVAERTAKIDLGSTVGVPRRHLDQVLSSASTSPVVRKASAGKNELMRAITCCTSPSGHEAPPVISTVLGAVHSVHSDRISVWPGILWLALGKT